jgi:hypothetical protein
MDKKLALAEKFLKEAWSQLKKYEDTKEELNLRQACEKGWGVVAQALKAVNPKIRRHADFGRTATKLAEEYNDKEMVHGEAMGEHLHREGFYEGHLNKKEVEYGLMSVEDFLKSIDNILMNGKKTKD